MTEDNQLINLIAGFTSGGTPLQATVGSKSEWMVTILTASMLANENLAASMVPEEMVDACYQLHECNTRTPFVLRKI
jgi:hypothetical protein